jgi:pentatricopeptide repeat protein
MRICYVTRKNILPNVRSYSVFINGLCKGGCTKMASGVLNEMLERGLIPSSPTFNMVIRRYCKDVNLKNVFLFT